MKTASTLLAVVLVWTAACSSGGAGTLSSGVDGGGSDSGIDASDASAKDGASLDGATGVCHSDAQCQPSFYICVGPGQALCGGPAPEHACDTDANCADAGANRICVTAGCGATSCEQKCTSDAACATTPAGLETCSLATGRCVPKACTSTSCPTDFACSSDSAKGCERKSCTTDSECSGSCINGLCWPGAGKCVPIPV